VRGVMLAGFPDFVKKECAGLVGAAMQIELQAAFFLARRGEERAEFGFEEQVLAFFGAHDDDQGYGVFGELYDCSCTWPAASGTPGRAAGFRLGHDGGDCIPIGAESKGIWGIAAYGFGRKTRQTGAGISDSETFWSGKVKTGGSRRKTVRLLEF
jgi:hypothetical protein